MKNVETGNLSLHFERVGYFFDEDDFLNVKQGFLNHIDEIRNIQNLKGILIGSREGIDPVYFCYATGQNDNLIRESLERFKAIKEGLPIELRFIDSAIFENKKYIESMRNIGIEFTEVDLDKAIIK